MENKIPVNERPLTAGQLASLSNAIKRCQHLSCETPMPEGPLMDMPCMWSVWERENGFTAALDNSWGFAALFNGDVLVDYQFKSELVLTSPTENVVMMHVGYYELKKFLWF